MHIADYERPPLEHGLDRAPCISSGSGPSVTAGSGYSITARPGAGVGWKATIASPSAVHAIHG